MSTWSDQRAEEHLLGLELFGMRFGLERMRRLMTALGSPQRSFRAVHVVGTNGKSSTVRMTAALLEAHGVRTGSYLSPHLTSFAERIRIADRDVESFGVAVQRAAVAAEKVDRTLTGGERVTQFELLTAAAFAEFAARGVEVAVVEAGLGGRHDATNVLDAEVVVLTNVGLEHTRWLGPTVEDIAREKLAVVRPGALLITPVGDHLLADLDATVQHPVPGPQCCTGYQAENFAAARAAAEAIAGTLDAVRVEEVARSIRVPGRMHWLADDVLLDGAHNPSGIEALVASLPFEQPVLVASILDDKDSSGMLRPLVDVCSRAVFTASANPRALPPATLASLWEQLGGAPAEIEPDPRRAVEVARSYGRPVLVTGSIYLVGDLVAPPGTRRVSAL